MISSLIPRLTLFRFGREAVLVAFAYMLYEVVRSLSSGRALDAFENAEVLVRVERGLGIFAELNVQATLVTWHGLVDALSLWYFWGHFPLLIAMAVWAFYRHHADYAWTRNAIFASGAIALVIYLTFPVAPPRLLPGAGFVDTLRGVFALQYEDSSLVNQFAAVPSMHLGFAMITGMTMHRMVGGRKGAGLALALPLVMLVSIVATGNHWFLDAVLGALVALIGMRIAGRIERGGPWPAVLPRRWRRSKEGADPLAGSG